MPKTSLPVITPRGIEINTAAGSPFEAVKVAREMLHTNRVIALATIDPGSGYPYNTVTNLALLPDGAPLFFAAGLALHARNMEVDPRISITLVPAGRGDVLTLPRLSLVGKAIRLSGEEFEAGRDRYAARYPKGKLYLSLPDTLLYRMDVSGVQINGGPGRNANDVTPANIRIDLDGADDLLKNESAEIGRLNADASLINVLAEKAGTSEGKWRISGMDPHGIDMVAHETFARLWFPKPVLTRDELAAALTTL